MDQLRDYSTNRIKDVAICYNGIVAAFRRFFIGLMSHGDK